MGICRIRRAGWASEGWAVCLWGCVIVSACLACGVRAEGADPLWPATAAVDTPMAMAMSSFPRAELLSDPPLRGLADADGPSCTYPTQRLDCGPLTCNATTHRCGPCTDDAQCYEEGYACVLTSSSGEGSGRCVMRDLKDAFGVRVAFGPIVAMAVCSVAVVAGVGGGAILVPAYVLLFGLPIGDAVPLSQATILGQSLVNAVLLVQRHHPKHSPPSPTWPVINYEYLVLLLPFLMVGTMLGSIGNKVSPGWFRVVLLFALVVFVLYRLVRKTLAQRRRDANPTSLLASDDHAANGDGRGTGAGAGSSSSPHGPVNAGDGEGEGMLVSSEAAAKNSGTALLGGRAGGYADAGEDDDGPMPCVGLIPRQVPISNSARVAATALLEGGDEPLPCLFVDAKPQYPWRLYAFIALAFAAQFAFTFASNHKLGVIPCGSVGYWLLIPCAVLWSFGIAALYRRYLGLLKEASSPRRRLAHPNVVPFVWNKLTSIVFPIVSFVAGSAAAMLGVGGGMILNFLLLEADLAPEEVSATGGMATLLVAAQSALIFVLEGDLQWDFGLMLLAAGGLSTLIGQYGLVRPIKRRGLHYLFIVALIVIMVGSLATLGAYGIYETVVIASYGGRMEFGDLCRKTGSPTHS